MNDKTSGQKMFTSEFRRKKILAEKAGIDVDAIVGDTSGVSNADILRAIEALRRDLHSHQAHSEDTPKEEKASASPEDAKGAEDAKLLRNELYALSRSIQETKAEIVALRPAQEGEDRLAGMTDELDAVVMATEAATETILDSTEKIDQLAQSIRLAAADEQEQHMADEIMETAIKVFEACNFQDLTGQRITKVVNTLRFIEERIDAMIEIWGSEAFADVDASVKDKKEGDAALLQGPQLEGEGVSQNDIDKLFG
ncbi:MAG: protein phosphatase CheZ [Rhodospirillales bacterium]|nr:protein phosphatase CheZ [Rhodospirillales bacterium]MCW8970221.1 protein phosphatase CheZ [Rhodospirillales bacterium]MCW9002187.1 protein phosphatase CheZ [Rhodospirillales bacterium]